MSVKRRRRSTYCSVRMINVHLFGCVDVKEGKRRTKMSEKEKRMNDEDDVRLFDMWRMKEIYINDTLIREVEERGIDICGNCGVGENGKRGIR